MKILSVLAALVLLAGTVVPAAADTVSDNEVRVDDVVFQEDWAALPASAPQPGFVG